MTQRTSTILSSALITGFITACVFFWLGAYACNESLKNFYEQQHSSTQQHPDHR